MNTAHGKWTSLSARTRRSGKRFSTGVLLLSTVTLVYSTIFSVQSGFAQQTSVTTALNAQILVSDRYTRLQFPLSQAGFAMASARGGLLVISFDKPVALNTTSLAKGLSNVISSAAISADGKQLQLVLKDTSTPVRQFMGEKQIGVDFLPKGARSARMPTLPQATAPRIATHATNNATPLPATKPVATINTPATAAAAAVPVPATATPRTLKEKQDNALSSLQNRIAQKPALPEDEIPEEDTTIQTGTAIAPAEKNIPDKEKAAEATIAAMDKTTKESPYKSVTDLKETAEEVETSPGPSPAPKNDETGDQWQLEKIKEKGIFPSDPPDATPAAPNGIIAVQAEAIKDGFKLTFPWNNTVAAASYIRGNSLYILFNYAANLQMEKVTQMPFARNARQIAHNSFSIMRLDFRLPFILDPRLTGSQVVTPRMERNDTKWILNLTSNPREKPVANNITKRLKVSTERTQDGPRIFVGVNRPADSITLTDDALGSKITIIPLYQGDTATLPARNFTDVELLQTVQGIAFTPLNDTLTHKLERNGLSLMSSQTLHISPEMITDSAEEQRVKLLKDVAIVQNKKVPDTSIIPFPEMINPEAGGEEGGEAKEDKKEEGKEGEKKDGKESAGAGIIGAPVTGTLLPGRRALYDKMEKLPDSAEARSAASFDIARFYFSQGLYPEAAGVLRDTKLKDPTFSKMQDLDLLLGVSLYQMAHYSDAEAIFEEYTLKLQDSDNFNEMRLWEWASKYQRNITDRQNRQIPIPVDYVNAYDKFMLSYPPVVRYALGLLAAEERLENEDASGATTIMEVISYDEVPKQYEKDTSFILGKIAIMEGKVDKAKELLEPLVKQLDDRENRARATFELTKMELVLGEIDLKEAISRLEKLLVVWRGDQLELDLLKLLGELYVQNKQYSDGLKTWQTLVTNFPNTKEALFIAGKMKQTFITLFDKGDAYKLPHTEALALYFEFRELTPVGDLGDRIIQQLAQNFIDADLLDNSVAILTHQLRYRNPGAKRNLLSLQLASLQIKNRHPENVPDALTYMDYGNATEEELLQAKYLRADALVKLKKYKESYDLLVNDFSDNAQDIRLDAFWELGNWFGIMNIIEPRLYLIRENAPLPLSKNEIKQLTMLSVAYAAQQDNDSLNALRKEFADRIENPQILQRFMFATLQDEPLRHAQLGDSLQQDVLERFIDEYGFWPAKRWKDAITVLSKRMPSYEANADTLTLDQQKDVVRYAIALTQRLKELNPNSDKKEEQKEYKDVDKSFKDLTRIFRAVVIDSTVIDVFRTFDPRLTNKFDDGAVFAGKVPLTNTAEFVDQYKAAKSITELNAVVK